MEATRVEICRLHFREDVLHSFTKPLSDLGGGVVWCGCRLTEALSASESRCGELEGRATRALEDARTLRTQLESAKTQQRALQQVRPRMFLMHQA